MRLPREKIGAPGADSLTASDWMRIYFGHARLIHRVALQLLDEFPAARPSLYRQFQNLRSRLSNAEFAVVDGRIFLQRQESLTDPELPLRMFRFMARHGLSLSSSAEHQIEEVLPALAASPPKGAQLWHYLTGNSGRSARRGSAAHDAFASPAYAAIAGISGD